MIDFQRSGFGVHLQDFVVFIYSDDYQINFNILHQFTDIYSSKIWFNLDIWAQNLSNLRPNIKREKKKKKLMTKLINRRFPILYTILFYKSWWRGYKVVNYKKGNRRRPCAGVSHPQKKKAKAFSILIISINRSIPDVKSSVN